MQCIQSVLPDIEFAQDSSSLHIASVPEDIQFVMPGIESPQDTVLSYPDSLSASTQSLLGDIQFVQVDTLSLTRDIQYQPPGTEYSQADNLLKTQDILSSQQGI